DDAALDGAWDLVKSWSAEQRERLRADVPKLALRATVAGRNVQDIARDALALSREGLRRRACLDGSGQDETKHLTYAEEIVASGRTPAERLLEQYHGAWGGSVLPAFHERVF
ncbi:MAG TPA: glutamate--cysteine ligase, partial [Microvirga sp.]|nr:glutamate--cysteine ligase [Microvirga sp.]